MLQAGLAICLLVTGFDGLSAMAIGQTATMATPAAPMSTRPASERIAWLKAEIARHDELYFKHAAPEISDYAYDQLKRELRALVAAHSETAAVGGVGDDRSGRFPVYRHRERMRSLEKSYTEAELRTFVEKVQRQLGRQDAVFVIEPKFDGLAISVTYEHGKLTRAVTRGDGLEGDDVTANLQTRSKVPPQLIGDSGATPEFVELRGEVYLTYDEFNRLNREREAAGEEPFAHPRNLAVGTLKQAAGEDRMKRRLSVVFYGVGACEPASAQPASQQALLKQLRAWGLPTVDDAQAASGVEEVWKAVQDMRVRRKRLAFPTDGAVVKLDDVVLQHRLGETNEAPRWAIAYKFPPDRVSTRVTDITLQIGRTGVLSPVAELAEVKIGGSTVRRASLHNRQEIARQDIRVGDFVFLEKAGEIIPAITGVDRARRPAGATAFDFPQNCPSCGAGLLNEGPTVRCPNYDCPARLQRRLEYFVSDGAVDIHGIGKTTIAALVAKRLVAQPADFYALRREDWLRVASPKTADKIMVTVEASKRQERWRFICAVGVPDVGPAAAKALAKYFPDLTAWARATEGDYAASSLGDSTRRASLDFFANPARRREVEALQQAIQAKE